jgi:hypothetical protein
MFEENINYYLKKYDSILDFPIDFSDYINQIVYLENYDI